MLVIVTHWSPFRSVERSQYSVSTAFSLYGTPFFLKYPGRRLVVTIFNDPPLDARPRPRRPPSHSAIDSPCHVALVAWGFTPPKWRTRVCEPASVSTLSVLAS